VVKIELEGDNELDWFVRKELKPFMYQTPSLYRSYELNTGVVVNSNKEATILTDQKGLYFTTCQEQPDREFQAAP
jgi:hypothetical protein